MPKTQLNLATEELQAVLARAQQIAQGESGAAPLEERFAAYLQATDELGLPREAVLQALREQLGVEPVETAPGTRLFAPAPDGFHYPAVVEAVEKAGVRVRFCSGGEALCRHDELRPLALAPGTLLQGCWGGDNGWYAARVRQYDEQKGQVTVVYRADGVVELLPMERIRMKAARPGELRAPLQWVPLPLLDLALKLAAGGMLGFLLARLLGS